MAYAGHRLSDYIIQKLLITYCLTTNNLHTPHFVVRVQHVDPWGCLWGMCTRLTGSHSRWYLHTCVIPFPFHFFKILFFVFCFCFWGMCGNCHVKANGSSKPLNYTLSVTWQWLVYVLHVVSNSLLGMLAKVNGAHHCDRKIPGWVPLYLSHGAHMRIYNESMLHTTFVSILVEREL